MGDLGQFNNPLVNAFALQLGTAIFGDHKIDVASGGCHSCAFRQMGDYPGNRAVLGGGRKGDDGETAL